MSLKIFFISAILTTAFASVQAQEVPDSTGLPGDNFSLQGALELFKKSASPEEFEKALNTENNSVNNLDLNEDGNTDYVKVITKTSGAVQTYILQVPLSETENQDVAVIELEKTGAQNAIVQILGDADLYGDEEIVEPVADGNETGFLYKKINTVHGPSVSNENINADGIIVNVWAWPIVRFVYSPSYVVWISPWHWHAYPVWWRPWRPVTWVVFYPRRSVYYAHYSFVRTRRIPQAQRLYAPTRASSATFRNRNQVQLNRYRTTHQRPGIQKPSIQKPVIQRPSPRPGFPTQHKRPAPLPSRPVTPIKDNRPVKMHTRPVAPVRENKSMRHNRPASRIRQ